MPSRVLTSVVTAPDGVRLAVRERGDPAGPPVLLLHGYPDDQTVWDAVVPRLAGFRVLTYDARGAGWSGAPAGARRYALPVLAADLVAVLDAVSPDAPVHLVGHDWGAIALWEPVTDPALAHRIASFTAISGPCLDHAGAWLRGRFAAGPRGWAAALRQLRRSWYTLWFQVPLLPDLLWQCGLAGRVLQRAERLPRRPAAADGRRGLALYRANMFRRAPARERRTAVPVQLVVLTRDRFVAPALMADAARWAAGEVRQRTLAARHWAPLTHPEPLARWIAEFATEVSARAAE